MFEVMFPDSKIPRGYKQSKTKSKYTIHLSIFKKLLLEDLNDTVFTFKFDESTTQQVNKQYDVYVQYWSKKHKCVKFAYCGIVMVDHCIAEKLLEHFLELVEKVKLNIKFMLHISMDGPNVNVKFERLLKSSKKMKSLNTNIISIGTCPLHIVHNAFRAGVNVLNFNIDSFAIGVNFFFKHSAARRSDYRQIEDLAEIISRFIQKHSSTRWVTLRRICSLRF